MISTRAGSSMKKGLFSHPRLLKASPPSARLRRYAAHDESFLHISTRARLRARRRGSFAYIFTRAREVAGKRIVSTRPSQNVWPPPPDRDARAARRPLTKFAYRYPLVW